MTRRCEVMAKYMTQQLWKDIAHCECFSLQLDESTDVCVTAQLCILIRKVFTDMTAKEELLTILPMKKKTRGDDIFQSFKFNQENPSPCVQIGVNHHSRCALIHWPREWIYCQAQGGRCFPRLSQLPLHNTPTSIFRKNAKHERDNGCGNEDCLFYLS